MAEKKLQDLPPSYTNLGFDGEPVAGPSAPKIHQEDILHEDVRFPATIPTAPNLEDIPRTLVYNAPSLVFEEIYEACADYVKSHCCYGSRFINQMKLTEIVNRGVFHYILESYGEKRESAPHISPYKGGPIDGPENGPPPDAWDMNVSPSVMFQDSKAKRQIPHTEEVFTCPDCSGRGYVTCSSCGGSGRSSCFSCGGSGRNSDNGSCSSCSGSGSSSCSSCWGSGTVTCSLCDGYGKVKKCRMLLVTWKNHKNDYITGAEELPGDKIRKAKGIVMLQDQQRELLPITNAPEQSANEGSASLLDAHQRSFPNELIIMQRHVLRVVPWTKVRFEWKDRVGEFYVYDVDRKVYFEDYPQPCCCCTCC